jgi:hypothetical protein
MPQQVLSQKLALGLKPLCPRDNHVMRYDPKGIEAKAENVTYSTPSYHCGFQGCSVRYTPEDGYFTVIDVPDLPHFVEEPGTNILQCPQHGTWLYRSNQENRVDGRTWRCGVDGCEYTRSDVGGPWLRQ